MQVNDILFALSIITFILAVLTTSAYLLHGGVWLAVASVVLYAGLPVWWALPVVAVTALAHLVVRFGMAYREIGRQVTEDLDKMDAVAALGDLDDTEAMAGKSGQLELAQAPGKLTRAKMAMQSLTSSTAWPLGMPRRAKSQQASAAQEE